MRRRRVDLTVETVVIDNGAAIDAVPVSVRKDVAQRVIPKYDQLIALHGDDVAARAGVAKTLLNRARLRHALGTTEEDKAAVADCLQAARLYAEAPAKTDNAFGHARALVSLGAILGPQQRFQEAITHLTQARLILEPLVAASTRPYRLSLLTRPVPEQRGQLPPLPGPGDRKSRGRRQGRPRVSSRRDAYTDAIDHVQRLVDQAPRTLRHREWLSRILGNLGDLHLPHGAMLTRHRSMSRPAGRCASLADCHRPRSRGANVTLIQECLATASLNYGDYLNDDGRTALAVAEFDRARLLYDRLNDRHPDEREFRWGQALARASLATALRAMKSTGSARTMLKEAARHYDLLVAGNPEVLQIGFERRAGI